jgi:hypothetical protein
MVESAAVPLSYVAHSVSDLVNSPHIAGLNLEVRL